MQLNCDTTIWTELADKYKMRDYVAQRGFAQYLPKLFGKWDNANEIDLETLPNEFVMKTNNGCASVIVVSDKNKVNWDKTRKKFARWLRLPFGYSGYEPHYLKITPCIIAEEKLYQNEELNKISPDSMIDYKFWCFNGHVESCFVAYDRRKDNLTIDLYDSKWNRLPQFLKNIGIDRFNLSVSVPKPVCLEKMIEIASALSLGHPQMRVDFYIVNDKPVIGELTMSSGYGYFTEEYYNYLGDLTDISLLKQKDK